MISLKKMQSKIDGLLSVFTKLIKKLEDNITELNSGILANKEEIANLEKQNNDYSEKIKEYDALAARVKGFINPV